MRFWQLPGVSATAVGFTGGHTPNPSYDEVWGRLRSLGLGRIVGLSLRITLPPRLARGRIALNAGRGGTG
jgi:hypothetical protein